ncbi:MAG TPA: hypothetical protein VIG62_11035 [Blastocatellia bacterium]
MSESQDDQSLDSDYAFWYSRASGRKFTRHLKSFHIVFDHIDDAAVCQEG